MIRASLRALDTGMDETDIPGAPAPHYYPSDDDVGKTIKVKVSFQDDDGFEEGPLASTATSEVPSSDTISVPWSATMTIGKKENTVNDIRYGFDDGVLLPGESGHWTPQPSPSEPSPTPFDTSFGELAPDARHCCSTPNWMAFLPASRVGH